ncbi:MAG: FMN-binding protein [Ignavibacteria bacterium]|nr:FMN-binding protein [Ignavibacteria bacterium]
MKQRSLGLILLLATGLLLSIAAAGAQVFSTRDEAISRLFPGREIHRKTLFLTDPEKRKIEEKAGTALGSKVVSYYIARGEEGVEGYLFFDTHTVRTMPETFMVAIRPDSTVARVEILAFHEPADYLPGERWLELFTGRPLTDDLWVKRAIPNITGATLSTRSINDGVRRFLAVFESAVPKEHTQ